MGGNTRRWPKRARKELSGDRWSSAELSGACRSSRGASELPEARSRSPGISSALRSSSELARTLQGSLNLHRSCTVARRGNRTRATELVPHNGSERPAE
eukprot:9366368-Alexandrium_andersonii.AAC.1